jgi:transposase
MQTVSTIGLDIAKSVFQVHAVDASGLVVIRRQLKRRYVLTFFEKLPCSRIFASQNLTLSLFRWFQIPDVIHHCRRNLTRR